jgi:lipid A 3-O-deacylase
MIRPLLVAAGSFLLLFCASTPATKAGPPDQAVATAPVENTEVDLFHTGGLELQPMTGALFSQQPTHSARPNFDYELTAIRLGYMLDTPRSHGFFRGNDEVLFEGSGAVIFQGPGTAIAGGNFLYRRNFVQPHSRFVPYAGINLGGIYSDIYHDKVQRAIGSSFDFNLGAHIGVRILVGHSPWSFDAEATYRHISDASITTRNDGIDAVGGLVGFSRFF